jgi:hypothetical protein
MLDASSLFLRHCVFFGVVAPLSQRDNGDASFMMSSGGFPKFPDVSPSFNGDDFAISRCLPSGGIC